MDVLIAAFTAMILGAPITAGAIVSGQQERLCAALGGVYQPTYPPAESCPGGKWSNFWRKVKD